MRERQDILVRQPYPQQQAMYMPAPYTAVSQGLPPEMPEPSLMAPILRQWWIVALFALIGCGAAIFYIKHTQPLYTANSKIYLPPISGAASDALGMMERGNYLSTQVEVIKSTTILNRVAAIDGMPQMKTFAPTRQNPVLFLREKLDVNLERKTDLIVVSLDSPYPEEAARIVNSVVESYSAYCQEEKDDRNNKVLSTLRGKRDEEQKGVEEMEQAVRDFRVKNPTITLLETSNTNLTLISQELTKAQLAVVEAKRTYAPAHQYVIRATNRFNELKKLYDEEMERAAKLNERGAELQRLTTELERKREFGKQLAERIHQLEMATGGRRLIEVTVVDPAMVPDGPSWPRTKRTLAVAVVAGALLGAGL